MSCYSPNFILFSKRKPYLDNSFKLTKDVSKYYRFMTGKEFQGKERDYFKKVFVDNDFSYTPVPCGCCLGCRLDYSKQWAARCMLEAEQWKDNYFITLTYDDNNLPIGSYGNATLIPDDFTNFIKRLRKFYVEKGLSDNVRIFGCGEYGDMSFRPHYHIILFNCPIPDLSTNFPYFENGKEYITQHFYNGVIYYYSDIIHNLWKKGNILIGRCEWQSCAYVARYVVKKIKGVNSDVYKKLGVVPEFVRMSRRPGIAYQYFVDHKDEIYEFDNIIVQDLKAPKVITPPRYYDNMLKLENELLYYDIKLDRQNKSNNMLNTIYNSTNLHYDEYLEVLEERKQNQIYALKRSI